MSNTTRRFPVILCAIGIAIYFLSIVWINFHGAIWNQMDIYTYTLEGRLIYETKSCFPDGWLFGNQYLIIGSPNIAAFFYGLTHESSSAMALASSLSSLLILLSFWWCFKGYLSRKGMAVGLLCLVGGIIFGTSASTYISGLQVLHTMASFYACYLIVLLITLGCYFRLKRKESAPWFMIVISILTNFALGMQSLRQLLILAIPLVIMEGLVFLVSIVKHKPFKEAVLQNGCMFFVLGVFLTEVAGHFYMLSLHVPTTPIIGDVALDLSPSGLFANLWASTKNLIRIAGISIVVDGIRYLPLSICALLVFLTIPWSIVQIIKKNDRSILAQAIFFSIISVFGVYFVGIFLMRTRDIYYFIYWLLATLSVAYCIQYIHKSYIPAFLVVMLTISAINYGYSFIPNYIDYHRNHRTVEAFTQKLVNDGIEVIYVDSSPIFAACSKDRIISQSYWLDVNLRSGYPLYYFPSDKYVPAYDDEHYSKSLICISGSYLKTIPTLSKSFQDALYSNLKYYDEFTVNNKKYVFYKPTGRVIDPSTESALQ
ncbi:MAG: hypothetical protein IJP73_04270 [Bacteroidales bacterium]|nr:hypothetical protein [Bacteroidales bacterium]